MESRDGATGWEEHRTLQCSWPRIAGAGSRAGGGGAGGAPASPTSMTSSSLTMLSWFMRFRMDTSLSRLCLSLALSLARFISLTAASSPVTTCCARHTMAKDPAPMWAPRAQSPTLRWGCSAIVLAPGALAGAGAGSARHAGAVCVLAGACSSFGTGAGPGQDRPDTASPLRPPQLVRGSMQVISSVWEVL